MNREGRIEPEGSKKLEGFEESVGSEGPVHVSFEGPIRVSLTGSQSYGVSTGGARSNNSDSHATDVVDLECGSCAADVVDAERNSCTAEAVDPSTARV